MVRSLAAALISVSDCNRTTAYRVRLLHFSSVKASSWVLRWKTSVFKPQNAPFAKPFGNPKMLQFYKRHDDEESAFTIDKRK